MIQKLKIKAVEIQPAGYRVLAQFVSYSARIQTRATTAFPQFPSKSSPGNRPQRLDQGSPLRPPASARTHSTSVRFNSQSASVLDATFKRAKRTQSPFSLVPNYITIPALHHHYITRPAH